MFNILYYIYFRRFRSQTLDRWHVRIIARLTNIIIPVYFRITALYPRNKLIKGDRKSDRKLIVSLTSFPARIGKTWLPIETILRQKVKPDRIILCLYEDEFNGSSSLPRNLLKQQKRGLEIRFYKENLRPHMKYYYTMLENPDDVVLTIDDDMLYPPDLIGKLIRFHKMYPEAICCPVTRRINLIDEQIRPYNEWDYLRHNTPPDFQNLNLGISALFPPKSLYRELFNKKDLIRIALSADDLWLKVMSLKKKTGVVSMGGEYPRFFIPVIRKNNISLMNINIGEGQNDRIFNELIRYYKIPVSVLKEKVI